VKNGKFTEKSRKKRKKAENKLSKNGKNTENDIILRILMADNDF